MKLIIKLISFFCLAIIVLMACTSKTPQPQKTMAVPATNTSTQQINQADSTGEPIIDVLEPLPEFPGGEKKMIEFISKNLHYPAIAEDKGIEGTVVVSFAVTKTGKIGKIKVIRSLCPACDREVVRVVATFPNFVPVRQNGENEDVNYSIPIKFKLE